MQTESEVLDTLRGFVAGEIAPVAFRDTMYASCDAYESFLENDPSLSRSNYVDGSVFQFLLQCDFDDAGGVLDAQGAITDFMDRNGHPYEKSDAYSDTYKTILSAAPAWLDADNSFVKKELLPQAKSLQGKELNKWLSDQIKKHYRFVIKPPKWIQNPAWPHGKAGPMTFLGQFEVNDYFHDAASVYVFYDEASAKTETLIQCM